MYLISPTEPPEIKRLGRTSPKPERYGVDVLWFNKRGKFGVQRKQFPGDFLASLHDGRLQREMAQMQSLTAGILIIEGFGQWSTDGRLLDQRQFTKQQFFSLVTSFHFQYGMSVQRVRDMLGTAQAIHAFYAWSEKDNHRSLDRRPNPAGKWGTADSREWAIHLLQSFEGIGPVQVGGRDG
jgi:ERCC4-type nuclease